MPERPLVGIVVVNYNGGDLTMRCLQRLHELTWPGDRLRIVLVDNGSHDGIPEAVRERWPDVEVIEVGRNLGFGGACNRGFDVLTDVDYVALVNNDAVPEPDWLEPLVDALESDPRLGAATPKVLLTGSWIEVRVTSESSRVGGDPRDLGVQVGAVLVDSTDLRDQVRWKQGTWGVEHTDDPVGPTFQWTNGDALGLLPAAGEVDEVALELAAPPGRTAVVRCGLVEATAAFDAGTTTVTVRNPGPAAPAINNVGMCFRPDGAAVDRGFLDLDEGQYDVRAEVPAWSGAAVLIRRSFLQDVGGFDEPMFLYYEDVDLSLRGAGHGWTYLFVPTSLVHHHHSATVGSRPALVRHLSERNRLVILLKHAPPRLALRAMWSEIWTAARTVWIDVLGATLRRQPPRTSEAKNRLRILAAVVRSLPRAAAFRLANRADRAARAAVFAARAVPEWA